MKQGSPGFPRGSPGEPYGEHVEGPNSWIWTNSEPRRPKYNRKLRHFFFYFRFWSSLQIILVLCLCLTAEPESVYCRARGSANYCISSNLKTWKYGGNYGRFVNFRFWSSFMYFYRILQNLTKSSILYI